MTDYDRMAQSIHEAERSMMTTPIDDDEIAPIALGFDYRGWRCVILPLPIGDGLLVDVALYDPEGVEVARQMITPD